MRSLLLLLTTALLVAGCGQAELQTGGRPAPPPQPPTVATPAEDDADEEPTETPEQADPWVRRLFVAPGGSDSAAGDSAAPLRTLARAISVARPGDLITVRAGTYAERVLINAAAGTADKPIRLQGEGKPKLILPAGVRHTLLTTERPYWQVAGFEIDMKGIEAYAAAFTGDVRGSVLADSELHSGTAGAGVSLHDGANGATIENNLIHHFRRSDDSHGIIIQPTTRNTVVRGNVIHSNSGDSIQCIGPESYYAAGTAPADNILIAENDMSRDREQAVDIKTCTNVTVRDNVMHDYLQSLPGGCAMVVHMSARDVVIENNHIFNVGRGIAIGGNTNGAPPRNVTIRRNRISNVVTGNQLEGNALVIANAERVTVTHNTLTGVDHAAIRLGSGATPTAQLTVQNNIVQLDAGAVAFHAGPAVTGLVTGTNLFWPQPGFIVSSSGGAENLSLQAWRALGRDVTSRVEDPRLTAGTFVPGPAAVDWGADLGVAYCGAGPDVGAVETGCD